MADDRDLEMISAEINVLLSLTDNNESVASAKDECTLKLPSCQEMLVTYMTELRNDSTKFQYYEYISSEFPFHNLFFKSKVLEDKQLFEAILYSKVFDTAAEFNAHRHKYEGELVWVTVDSLDNACVRLVSHDRIIYGMTKLKLYTFRDNMQKARAFFQDKIEKNGTEAVSMPKNTQDSINTPSTSVARQIQCSMTIADEMKKAMLDELNSFNLDARVKQKFKFDLEMLPDQDLYSWNIRLDTLRLCSNMATTSFPGYSELNQLSEITAKLDKIIGHKEILLASLDELVKPKETGCSDKFDDIKKLIESIESEEEASLYIKKFIDHLKNENDLPEGLYEDGCK